MVNLDENGHVSLENTQPASLRENNITVKKK